MFTPEDVLCIPSTASHGAVGMDPITFDVVGKTKLLQNLDCKKANSPDNIPTRLIKVTALEIAEVLYFLFSQSYSLNQHPVDWCKANVVTIFKKRQQTRP